jgi:hypothetical protein
MTGTVPAAVIRDMQDMIGDVGQAIDYQAAGAASAITILARCRYLSALELANSIEAYPLVVTCDARDFPTRAPQKGDTFTIDGARRGIMQVREIRASGQLIGYGCGVQG